MKQFTKKTATVVFLAMLTMQAYSQATKTGQNKSLSNKELFDSGANIASRSRLLQARW